MKTTTTLLLLLSLGYSGFAQTVDHNYGSQKTKILKMEFFSPLTNHTTFGFEEYLKDGVSWEAKIGFIGWGADRRDIDPKGFSFRGGPKFKLNPDFVTRDLRGSHPLSGKYIRPELVFSTYSEDEVEVTSTGERRTRESFLSFGFLINYGRQYVLADIMSLDWHVGIGYSSNTDDGGKYHYSHFAGGSDFPIAVAAGVTIGVLLK